MRTHRVGTLTLGIILIAFGVLFLLRIFMAALSYDIIFKLWPFIFIFLGVEILIANFKPNQEKLIYDKSAIAIMIILSFFAVGMAITEFVITHASTYLY